MVTRCCQAQKDDGSPCRARPLRDAQFCIMHSPEHAEEMKEARRLGGLRRRREVTVQGAYNINGLETVADIQRLVEIAALDILGLENSIARARALLYAAQVAGKLLEVGVLEERAASLEAFVQQQRNPA